MNTKELIERSVKMIDEMGIPVTKFCEKVSVSTSTYYKWKRGELDITQDRMREIDNFLARYNY